MKFLKIIKRSIERTFAQLLPASINNLIGGIYGQLIPGRKSYSQYGEDLILINYFKKIGIENGYYVDIGAFHPKLISNTYLLHKQGWSGLCIDVDENKLRWFRLLRGQNVKTLCGAICGKKTNSQSKAKFYKHNRFLSEIDTLDKSVAEQNKVATGWGYQETEVPLISIKEVFNANNFSRIDLLNIDVEGMDTEILMNIDFSKTKPKVILFEDNENFGGSTEIKQLLKDQGYSLLFISGGSAAFFLK